MPPAIAAIAAIAPDGQLTTAQRRRFLISVSLRRQQPGTGSAPQFLRERSAHYAWPDLRAILKGIRWAVVGAVATRAYMPERMTRNFDILVHHQDGDAALARLKEAGYPVLDLPYLVLMKMEMSRAQDLADLSKMLGLAAAEDLTRIREIVARYLPAALEDLESLIYLGGLEMKGT